MCRCEWVTADPAYQFYHDQEWGVPSHDDQYLFEMLILKGAQAGLSWITILKMRDNYRAAFFGFDSEIIARFSKRDVQTLLNNNGIVRNRLKIDATISNARAFLEILEDFESFDTYIWQFVEGKPIINRWETFADIPTSDETSKYMSKDLSKRGFKFVGPAICYAFMQAVGMINDHTVDCYRHRELLL